MTKTIEWKSQIKLSLKEANTNRNPVPFIPSPLSQPTTMQMGGYGWRQSARDACFASTFQFSVGMSAVPLRS